MRKIEAVFVKKDSLYYVCMARHSGFICGQCNRGNLGPSPKVGQACRVCKSRVSQVATDATLNLRLHPMGLLP